MNQDRDFGLRVWVSRIVVVMNRVGLTVAEVKTTRKDVQGTAIERILGCGESTFGEDQCREDGGLLQLEW